MGGSTDDKSMSVKIAGETIKVYSDKGPEHIVRMANYINYITDEFNAKKGHSVRQTTLLAYAALEICNTLFTERDSHMSPDEREYEKKYQMELFSHKKTQDQLNITEKLLMETDGELAKVRKDLEKFVNALGPLSDEIKEDVKKD